MGCGSSRCIVTAAAAAVDVADIEPTAAAVSRGMQCAEVARAQPPARVAVAARSFAECGLVDVSLSTLSQLTTAQRLSFAGPTETSNWLVPGRVLVGSCPGTHCYTTAGDEGTRLGSSRETVLAELTLLRDAGVTAFFNFQHVFPRSNASSIRYSIYMSVDCNSGMSKCGIQYYVGCFATNTG